MLMVPAEDEIAPDLTSEIPENWNERASFWGNRPHSWPYDNNIPSGKHTKNYGKIHHF